MASGGSTATLAGYADGATFRLKRRDGGSKKFFLHDCAVSGSGHPKIVRYDFHRLVRWTALPTLFHLGTVFRLDNGVLVQMAFYACFFVLAFFGVRLAGDVQHFKDSTMENMLDVRDSVQRFCPFLFGMFVSSILTRWWNIRTTAVGATADHIMGISGFLVSLAARILPDDDDWEVFTVNHTKVVKYGLASLTIMANESRKQCPGNKWKDLIDLGLLTEDEKNMLCDSSNGAVTLWCWMNSVASEMLDMMKIPAPNHNMLYQDICLGACGIHDLHRHLHTQLPFPYVHMITLLVNVHNIVTASVAGMQFAIAVDANLFLVPAVEVCQFIMVPVLYVGLLQICVFLSDPMGTDIIDFPVREYQMEVCDTCCEHIQTLRQMYNSWRRTGTAPLPNAHVIWKLGEAPQPPVPKAPAAPAPPTPAPSQALPHPAPEPGFSEMNVSQAWSRLERKFDELSDRVSNCVCKGMEAGLLALHEERERRPDQPASPVPVTRPQYLFCAPEAEEQRAGHWHACCRVALGSLGTERLATA